LGPGPSAVTATGHPTPAVATAFAIPLAPYSALSAACATSELHHIPTAVRGGHRQLGPHHPNRDQCAMGR
jgi:hypothetical protein